MRQIPKSPQQAVTELQELLKRIDVAIDTKNKEKAQIDAEIAQLKQQAKDVAKQIEAIEKKEG